MKIQAISFFVCMGLVLPILARDTSGDGLLSEILEGNRQPVQENRGGNGTASVPREALAVPLDSCPNETADSAPTRPSSAENTFPAATVTDHRPARHRNLYFTIFGGSAEIDHTCMPLLYRGDRFRDRNRYSENLDAKGWRVGASGHFPLGSFFELDSTFSFTEVSIDRGTIFNDDDDRCYFEDSDSLFLEGQLLLQHPFHLPRGIRPYLGVGACFCYSQIGYEGKLTYWYWRRSKKISRREWWGDDGTIDDFEIAPCANAGIEVPISWITFRLDVLYTTGMRDIWGDRDLDEKENLVFSADCRISLGEKCFLYGGVYQSKSSAIQDVHGGFGMFL